jgi:hypothetical protein
MINKIYISCKFIKGLKRQRAEILPFRMYTTPAEDSKMASNEESEHKFGSGVLLGPYKACNINLTEKV